MARSRLHQDPLVADQGGAPAIQEVIAAHVTFPAVYAYLVHGDHLSGCSVIA